MRREISKKIKNIDFRGKWRITEMELWDKDYIDMEVRAYLEIRSGGAGEFQFGLVSGEIDGEVIKYPDGVRFEFTWEGNDEYDHVSGSGWVKLTGKNTLEGQFKFHHGDRSAFKAKRTR
jgi:uncharacterized protein YndB with AHSA1/START domain